MLAIMAGFAVSVLQWRVAVAEATRANAETEKALKAEADAVAASEEAGRQRDIAETLRLEAEAAAARANEQARIAQELLNELRY